MSKTTSRPLFPTSSTEFGLATPSPNAGASTSSCTLDDAPLLLPRLRRPSLLAPVAGYQSESRIHSPLISSYTYSPRSRRGSSIAALSEESESDRERMLMDRSPSTSGSSQNSTPPLKAPGQGEREIQRFKTIKLPSTPPRKTTLVSESNDSLRHVRRPSLPVSLLVTTSEHGHLMSLVETTPDSSSAC